MTFLTACRYTVLNLLNRCFNYRAAHIAQTTWLWALVWALIAVSPVAAEVKLPSVFADHMVLQRDQDVPLWGWAEANEKVTVSINGKSAETVAGADGRWRVKLPSMHAGGPYEMSVRGKNELTIKDVYVGEVWVCSGQSNMAFRVSQVNHAKEEIAAANYPKLRMFTVKRTTAAEPQDDCPGTWAICSPESVAGFSAVGYFFGRELVKELNVPIGMLHTSWGGTRCEAWTRREALEGDADFQPILDRVDKEKGVQHRAAHLYNAMIHPLIPYGIRGAIWYQGESNLARAVQYRKLFPNMISDWRTQWGHGDFPFYFVQLAPFRYNRNDPRFCAELWEAQFNTLSLPHTGMAVINDIGNLKDIHPKNKQDVGRRLALWALAKDYGKTDLVYSGPLYRSSRIEGDKVIITFDHVGGGLVSRDGQPLDEFTIAGADQKFVPATATVQGDQVVVHSDDVAKPAAVRFAWHDSAQPNLVNKEGLPASSFRTDDWPLLTAGQN